MTSLYAFWLLCLVYAKGNGIAYGTLDTTPEQVQVAISQWRIEMSWRFRKTFKVLPSVKLKVARHGVTASIGAAPFTLVTHQSLEQLRTVLKDAYDEHEALTKEVSSALRAAAATRKRYSRWQRGFLMKRLRKKSFAARKEATDTAASKLEELQKQLALTTLATEITIDWEQVAPYYGMRATFGILSRCQKIWDVSKEDVDLRSNLNPISFSLGSCDLIQWKEKVPHLRHRTGGDMYIYPGFVFFQTPKGVFDLLDFRDISVEYLSADVPEATGSVPSDAQVVGKRWTRSNKDGSRDRRFRNNVQMPLVRYGWLLLRARNGLKVSYCCSNAASAESFAKSWSEFRMTFFDTTAELQKIRTNVSSRSNSFWNSGSAPGDPG
ncbi:MAG: hypothetical protein ABSF54_19085 [Bryobacteraceae bacterium]